MKKIICVIAIIALSLSFKVFANDKIKVFVNGTQVQFDVPPQTINNRTLVPMRTIFEAMRATIEWYDDAQYAIAKKAGITIAIQPNNLTMSKNDFGIELDVAPQIINDRIFIPVRAVAENFNLNVNWDEINNTINIDEIKLDTRQDVLNYVAENYPTVYTPFGNYKLITWSSTSNAYYGIGVGKNDDVRTPYDYVINIDFINAYDKYEEIFNSISYSDEQKEQYKNAFYEYQRTLANDLIDKLPNKKIRGGFLIDGYEYPHLLLEPYNYYYFGWKNYISLNGSSEYKQNILSDFTWFNFTERFIQ